MSVEKNVPAIRFKGFSGEWASNPIGEICGATFGGGTPSTNEKIFWQGEIPWIQSSDIKDGNLSSVTAKKYITKAAVNKSATKLISGNSIAIVTRVGVGKLSLMKSEYATSQDFLSLSDLKINSQYAVYVIWKQLQIEKEQVQGTSIKGITKEELLGKFISYPESAEEQTQIGNYFQKLDNLINQHQQKHDKLSSIKKAMLEKMFPKQGETVPEIRFKGFSGEWEEVTISTIADKFDNFRVAVTAKDRVPGNIPYYGANGIQDYVEGYTHDGEHVLLAEDGANDLKNYPIHYVNGKVWVNNHAHVLKAKENNSNIFLKYALNNIDFEPFLVGGGRAKLNASIMMNLELTICPDTNEQEKIGNYFQKLDALINQHQQQITKLNNIKQACLSKMFV